MTSDKFEAWWATATFEERAMVFQVTSAIKYVLPAILLVFCRSIGVITDHLLLLLLIANTVFSLPTISQSSRKKNIALYAISPIDGASNSASTDTTDSTTITTGTADAPFTAVEDVAVAE